VVQEVVGTTGIPVHATTKGGSKIVGHLTAGSQRFYWQVAGSMSRVGGRTDDVWAWTVLRDGHKGYVNELWFAPASARARRALNWNPFALLPWHRS
jgi:hypothetical protein